MKVKKILKKALIIIMIIALSYSFYVARSIYLYGNISEYVKVDAVIVLGAAIWDDKPSPVFEERIKHGIWLYKNGYASKIIFTGGKAKNKRYSESRVAMNYALENQIPKKDILIEEKSKITEENIFYAEQIVENNEFSKVIIVSDPLHMKRAMLMAKDYELEAYTCPTPTTKYKSLRSKIPFWSREVFYYLGYRMYKILL